MYKIPIIYIFYKRPDLVKQTFLPIKRIKPKVLYICQDGPKNNEERKKVIEARKVVLEMVDWDCKLVKIFRDKNQGLMGHIPDSLDQFFKNYDYGIYIEEDVLVSDEFFKFQKEMLERFKNNKKILGVNGFNPFGDKINTNYSFFLTQIACVWGMGIYKRLWDKYDLYCNGYINVFKNLEKENWLFSKKYGFYLKIFVDAINKGKLKTWDFQLNYASINLRGYFIEPSKNLVNNIGLNKGSNPSLSSYWKEFESIFPLRHPKKLNYDPNNDIVLFNNSLKGGWIRLWLIKFYLDLPQNIKNLIQSSISLFSRLKRKIL